MPAKSARQQRFMAMCVHNPEKARGKCPSKAVAKEYMHRERNDAVHARCKAEGKRTLQKGY